MSAYFGIHNISDTLTPAAGIGTVAIDVPFVPDYIKVDFQGGIKTPKEDYFLRAGEDAIYWDLSTIIPNQQYRLTIMWSTYTEREIYYRIARLTVDPV